MTKQNGKNCSASLLQHYRTCMKRFVPQPLFTRLSGLLSLPAMLASAALLSISFSRVNLFFGSWFFLIPLLFVVRNSSPWKAFGLALCTGILAYAGIFYWIFVTVYANTGSWPQSALSLLALSAYISLFSFGLWMLLLNKTSSETSPFFPWYAAALWVAFEYSRAYLLTGFPWALLGYSQWHMGPLIQIAEFSGVYGVSFLLVLWNASLFQSLVTGKKAPLLAASAVAALALLYGSLALSRTPEGETAPLTVCLLQGNIDQYKKWDTSYEEEIISNYSSLARAAAAKKPDLIIWPETAVPGYLPYDTRLLRWLTALAQETRTAQLIGSPYYTQNRQNLYYNSSLLMDSGGTVIGWHKKIHLVPFGEFVPLRPLLEPYFGILNALSDFTPGTAPTVLALGPTRLGITICSENFFGHLVRRFVLSGAGILVNQTNDAWFLDTSAPWQHFSMNVFRAIENRRTVLVSGNTGLTGMVDPWGRTSHMLPLFTAAFATVPASPMTTLTLYTRYGDFFAILCVLAVLAVLAGPALILYNFWKRKFT